MDDTIILVRALEDIGHESHGFHCKVGDIFEANDDGEFWHIVGRPSTSGFYKRRFEVVDEPISDVWTTP